MPVPNNLNIISAGPTSKRELVLQASINPEQWLENPKSWNRAHFVEKILELLEPNPTIAETSKVFMLASQVEVFVSCQHHIRQYGLTISQNNGVTLGQNPHLKIADSALYRANQLMKELGLNPGKSTTKKNFTPEFIAFLEGP
jgi:phage terminase small subunit